MSIIYEGMVTNYPFFILDASNTPVNLSAATSITATFTETSTTNVVGPINCTTSVVLGQGTVPLSGMRLGNYDVNISYTIGGITEKTFPRPVRVIRREAVSRFNTVNAANSTVLLDLEDSAGAPLNLTGKTVTINTHSTPFSTTFTVLPHTVINALLGKISVVVNTTSNIYGHVNVGGTITNDFLAIPV